MIELNTFKKILEENEERLPREYLSRGISPKR